MPRRFDRKTGWNRQFKWKPLRRDRWDPFPKDHLPFIDDFSVGAFIAKSVAANDMITGTKRTRDVRDTRKRKFEQERKDLDSARNSPAAKRSRSGNVTKNLFTNDDVATMGVAGAGAAGMAYTGAGIAVDRLNARIASGIAEGFAAHSGAQESGVYTYDALTESSMVGRYLTNMAEGMERIVPLVEDLLAIGLLV